MENHAYGPSMVHGKAKTSEQNLQFHPLMNFPIRLQAHRICNVVEHLTHEHVTVLVLSDQQRVSIQDVAGVMLRVVFGHPGCSLAHCSYVYCVYYIVCCIFCRLIGDDIFLMESPPF